MSRDAILITLAGLLWTVSASAADAADERYELNVDPADGRVVKVASQLQVTGSLYTQPGKDKALKLEVDAKFGYDERRLPGAGRDAKGLRAARYYDQASSSIHAGDRLSNHTLRDDLRLIVAEGKSDGLELFSPSGPLTYDELELLRTPGDGLLATALLPEGAVEVGESWKPGDWVMSCLTGIEAAEKTALLCRLEAVDERVARVSVEGEITGVVLGTPAHVKLAGRYLFDLDQRLLKRLEFTQIEKRSIGAVSPGLDLSARVIVVQAVNPRPRRLTEQDLAQVPLEANAASKLLVFDAPAWSVRFHHDRHWHLFHQNAELAILRLIDEGQPIAQCNIKRLADAGRGKHVSEEEFESDVRRGLGKNLQEIVQAEKLKLQEGLFVYRLVAVGAATRENEKKEPISSPMQWVYYLVANEEGRQLSLVFTIDATLAEKLESRDIAIVGGLEFLAAGPKLTPVKASK